MEDKNVYNNNGSEDSVTENIVLVDIKDAMSEDDDTANCSNIYCYTDELYRDMILAYIKPDTFECIIIVFYALVFIIGLVGNSLVCFAVWRNHHMRTVTNLFIVNLATADLLVILLCLPPTVLEDITETWYMGNIMCKAVKYAQGVSVSVSVLTLTAISVERYFAICEPMTFKGTMRRARAIITAIWCISLVLIIPDVISIQTHPYDYKEPEFSVLLTSCRPAWGSKRQMIFQICLIIALYFLPFCFMGFTYARIAHVLWSNNIPTEASVCRKSQGTMSNGKVVKSQIENQMTSRRKVAKMLIAVVVMFALCFLPVHMLNILRYSGVSLKGAFWTKMALVSHWVCYFNSAINPVIYNFMSAKFRQEFRAACCCCSRIDTSRKGTRTTRYGASTYTYKLASDTTQTEHITMTKISSASDDGNEPEVTVKLYPTMYENANAV